MGRIILLGLICFTAYWAWQYYQNGKTKKKDNNLRDLYGYGDKNPSSGETSKVDELIADFNKKIADIESKSIEEIKRSEELLNYYKQELGKLNNLKNK